MDDDDFAAEVGGGLIREQVTSSLKTSVLRSVASPPAGMVDTSELSEERKSYRQDAHPRVSNKSGSTFNGTSPNRCAKTSSTITDVLFQTYTCSIAIVGTSAIIIRRNAFAMDASTPMRSKEMVRGVRSVVLSFKF